VKALKASATTVSGVTVKELEGELEVSKTTAFRIAENLVHADMFALNEAGDKYSVTDP
jgi:DNA-binding IclR family transcriptional regulator